MEIDIRFQWMRIRKFSAEFFFEHLQLEVARKRCCTCIAFAHFCSLWCICADEPFSAVSGCVSRGSDSRLFGPKDSQSGSQSLGVELGLWLRDKQRELGIQLQWAPAGSEQ